MDRFDLEVKKDDLLDDYQNHLVNISLDEIRKILIKDICRVYKELPPHIVKQIIDYKLNEELENSLKEIILKVRYLNRTIELHKKEVDNRIKNIKAGETIEDQYLSDLIRFICKKLSLKAELMQTAREKHELALNKERRNE